MTKTCNRCILRHDKLLAVRYIKGGRHRHKVLFQIIDGNVIWRDPVTQEDLTIGTAELGERTVTISLRDVEIEQ